MDLYELEIQIIECNGWDEDDDELLNVITKRFIGRPNVVTLLNLKIEDTIITKSVENNKVVTKSAEVVVELDTINALELLETGFTCVYCQNNKYYFSLTQIEAEYVGN